MTRVLAVLRTTLYMTGFVLVWWWVAMRVSAWDWALLPPGVRAPGVALMLLGAALGLWCGALFAWRGDGTPAPFDAPRQFVAVGPYRWVRNPMYVGGLLLLIGFALWLRSPAVLLMAVALLIAAHLFVVGYEERTLERRFGEGYRSYKRAVHRWIPRKPR
jgi:protein-S-isoprenylcysteine O-methyltransferase Ste14